MPTEQDIRQRVRDAWFLNGQIQKLGSGWTLRFGNPIGEPTVIDNGGLWSPSSIDSSITYAIGVKAVQGFSNGTWLVPVFFGLVASTNDPDKQINVVTYLVLPMLFDSTGELRTTGWEVQLFSNSQPIGVSNLPLLPPFPSFSMPTNTALAAIIFGANLFRFIGSLITGDSKSSTTALSPLSGLIMNQSALGVRAVLAGQSLDPLDAAWRLYDQQIRDWAPAKGWQDKTGNAREFDSLRFWRPVVMVDEDTWSVSTKLDNIESSADDDDVLIVATGQRKVSGDRVVLTIETLGELNSPDRQFQFQIATSDGADVVPQWVEQLAARMVTPPSTRQFGNAIANRLQDFLTHLAAAEKPPA
ncbi:hypothetical protein ACNOYE_38790 [Nannocystaceae bacterium ST9]